MKYDNTNRGTLGKNINKKEESHPDASGSLNVNGVDYWISGWNKVGENGKFLSLSVKPKDAQKPKQEPKFIDDNLDDVAF